MLIFNETSAQNPEMFLWPDDDKLECRANFVSKAWKKKSPGWLF